MSNGVIELTQIREITVQKYSENKDHTVRIYTKFTD